MFYDGDRRDVSSFLTRTFSRSDAAFYSGCTLLKCINPNNSENHTNSEPVDGRGTAGVLFWHGRLTLKRLLTWTQAAERSLLGLPLECTHVVPALVTAMGWLWLAAGGTGLQRRLVAFKRQWRWFLWHDSCCLDVCQCSHRSRDGRICDRSRGFCWCFFSEARVALMGKMAIYSPSH